MINFDSDGANSIQLEIRLFRAKIQSPSNAKMASHLTFFFAAGLAFATPTHRTRVQRENFLSVFPRCAAKARGATSPERRIQIQKTAGNHHYFAFQTGGSEERVVEARRETRAFLFGDVRRTCFLLWRHLFFRGPIVGLRCFYRGVVKLERTLRTFSAILE